VRHGGRKLGNEIAVALLLALPGEVSGIDFGVQARELRQVDRACVAQSRDHFLGEITLDLIRPELADEAAQELPFVVIAFALELDRGKKVAVTLGDREMQPKLARCELLELAAYRADQRRVGAQVLGFIDCAGPMLEHTDTRLAHPRRARSVASRCITRLRRRILSPSGVHLSQHPALHGHDVLAPVSNDEDRQRPVVAKRAHACSGRQSIPLCEAVEEFAPGGLDRVARIDAPLERRQRQLDQYADRRDFAQLHDQPSQRVLHIGDAGR
jgi:hypothetical protein